ncbi:hypothetical protein A3Q56_05635, partial [Intoshia linei]
TKRENTDEIKKKYHIKPIKSLTSRFDKEYEEKVKRTLEEEQRKQKLTKANIKISASDKYCDIRKIIVSGSSKGVYDAIALMKNSITRNIDNIFLGSIYSKYTMGRRNRLTKFEMGKADSLLATGKVLGILHLY